MVDPSSDGRTGLLVDGQWIERNLHPTWEPGPLLRLIVEYGNVVVQLQVGPPRRLGRGSVGSDRRIARRRRVAGHGQCGIDLLLLTRIGSSLDPSADGGQTFMTVHIAGVAHHVTRAVRGRPQAEGHDQGSQRA
jgi:hypothetical protein